MYEKLQQPMPHKKKRNKNTNANNKNISDPSNKKLILSPPNKKKFDTNCFQHPKLNEKGPQKSKNKKTTEEKLRGWDFWKSIGSPKYVCAPMVDQRLGLVGWFGEGRNGRVFFLHEGLVIFRYYTTDKVLSGGVFFLGKFQDIRLRFKSDCTWFN